MPNLQTYQDRIDYWYPAIRFRKEDDVSRPLREKEKGDWKNLSLEDKKTRSFFFFVLFQKSKFLNVSKIRLFPQNYN